MIVTYSISEIKNATSLFIWGCTFTRKKKIMVSIQRCHWIKPETLNGPKKKRSTWIKKHFKRVQTVHHYDLGVDGLHIWKQHQTCATSHLTFSLYTKPPNMWYGQSWVPKKNSNKQSSCTYFYLLFLSFLSIVHILVKKFLHKYGGH